MFIALSEVSRNNTFTHWSVLSTNRFHSSFELINSKKPLIFLFVSNNNNTGNHDSYDRFAKIDTFHLFKLTNSFKTMRIYASSRECCNFFFSVRKRQSRAVQAFCLSINQFMQYYDYAISVSQFTLSRWLNHNEIHADYKNSWITSNVK